MFVYECPFCGKDDQIWRDLENGCSQCTGCRTVGTNSYEETCPRCRKQDYIFIVDKISKCFDCWNREDPEDEEALQEAEAQDADEREQRELAENSRLFE